MRNRRYTLALVAVWLMALGCHALSAPSLPLRVCALMEGKDGSARRVGLVDTTTGYSFVLREGESRRGIQVLAIDLASEEVCIEKDGQSVVLSLAGGDKEAGAASVPAELQVASRIPAVPRKALLADPTQESVIRGDVIKRGAPPPGIELLLSRP